MNVLTCGAVDDGLGNPRRPYKVLYRCQSRHGRFMSPISRLLLQGFLKLMNDEQAI